MNEFFLLLIFLLYLQIFFYPVFLPNERRAVCKPNLEGFVPFISVSSVAFMGNPTGLPFEKMARRTKRHHTTDDFVESIPQRGINFRRSI